MFPTLGTTAPQPSWLVHLCSWVNFKDVSDLCECLLTTQLFAIFKSFPKMHPCNVLKWRPVFKGLKCTWNVFRAGDNIDSSVAPPLDPYTQFGFLSFCNQGKTTLSTSPVVFFHPTTEGFPSLQACATPEKVGWTGDRIGCQRVYPTTFYIVLLKNNYQPEARGGHFHTPRRGPCLFGHSTLDQIRTQINAMLKLANQRAY